MAHDTIACQTVEYSRAKLSELLTLYSHNQLSAHRSDAKAHLNYLDEYLSYIGANTIIAEQNYTDRDYLEDYAAYYARCHEAYLRTCTRLHFFKEKFDDKLLPAAIAGDAKAVETLKMSYLGFVVLKPLPLRMIGRTCLTPYPDNNGHQRVFVKHKYSAHLLGIELEVESLPFQEQDQDVAACATSALWSVLHGTGRLFRHKIPTPAEITVTASKQHGMDGRALPAMNGLNAWQMADAIRTTGLEALTLPLPDHFTLKLAARAYLRAKIPCVIGGNLHEGSKAGRMVGGHAMALVGFREPTTVPTTAIALNTVFRSDGIERLYVHDDGVGPFARLRFEKPGELGTSWKYTNNTGAVGEYVLDATSLIVPLYHKVRVPIDEVLNTVVSINFWFDRFAAVGFLGSTSRIEWDLLLEQSNDVKQEVFDRNDLPSDVRIEFLKLRLPRFVWRVTARMDDVLRFELFFDATDLVGGGLLCGTLRVDTALCQKVGTFFSDPNIAAYFEQSVRLSAMKVAKWFTSVAAAPAPGSPPPRPRNESPVEPPGFGRLPAQRE